MKNKLNIISVILLLALALSLPIPVTYAYGATSSVVDMTVDNTENGGDSGKSGSLAETSESTTSSSEKSGTLPGTNSTYVTSGGIDSDDYKFGDSVLPDVDEEGFFTHIYNKMFEGVSVFQSIGCIVFVFFFILSLIMIIVSWFGQRQRVAWFITSAVLCAVLFVADLYVVEIIAAFKNWFVK